MSGNPLSGSNASTSSKGGYVTRQSNTQTGAKAGGAVIYGCRGAAGGTAGGSAPCIRANNLAQGFAFEFNTSGAVGGLISVGAGGAATKPFTTNATGVATGLNADQVDGKGASELVQWAKVLANGTLNRNFGATSATRINAGNYRVDFGENISQCTYQATPVNVNTSQTAHADLDVTNDNRVFVSIRNSTNAARQDGDFQVAVHC
ncbi:MAG: hypothetical protein ACR2NA_10435 [Solirubrobacterales bacterium]